MGVFKNPLNNFGGEIERIFCEIPPGDPNTNVLPSPPPPTTTNKVDIIWLFSQKLIKAIVESNDYTNLVDSRLTFIATRVRI